MWTGNTPLSQKLFSHKSHLVESAKKITIYTRFIISSKFVTSFYRKYKELLTEGEEAEDDGVGDEVHGVAGASEVKLPCLYIRVYFLKFCFRLK